MKIKLCIVIFSLIIPIELLADPQDPETLIYGNDTLQFYYFPLEYLRLYDSNINNRVDNYFKSTISTNWRGYIGTWKIENDSLFLVQIEHDKNYKTVDLKRIFDTSKISDNGVFAYWYTEIITTNFGEFLGFNPESDPMFYSPLESVFYTANLSCTINSGKVTDLKINYRSQDEISNISKRIKEAQDTMICLLVEEFPKFITPDKIYSWIEIDEYLRNEINSSWNGKQCPGHIMMTLLIEKDGSLSRVNIIRSTSNQFCENEAIRIVKSMKTWEPGKVKGENVRTQIMIVYREEDN